MDTQKIIRSQYLAALAMFDQVIVKCPAALLNAPGNKNKLWKHAKASNWIEQGYNPSDSKRKLEGFIDEVTK